MALALFDLDNTLLNGDSDHAWGMYLAEIGVVDPDEQQKKQDYFYQQYLDGELDIYEFCEYQFEVLASTPLSQLQQWHADFMQRKIEPMIASGKPHLVEHHRQLGDTLIIITATNDFVTAPIAERLGVSHLIACNAEFKEGRYTGKLVNTPAYQQGKLVRIKEWIAEHGGDLETSTFYSDSINDLPLLQACATPVVVTPDNKLRAHARQFHWRIID